MKTVTLQEFQKIQNEYNSKVVSENFVGVIENLPIESFGIGDLIILRTKAWQWLENTIAIIVDYSYDPYFGHLTEYGKTYTVYSAEDQMFFSSILEGEFDKL